MIISNGYDINNIYIFRFEPVKWRILTESDGKATLISEIILDSQNFNANKENNNYATSSIRNWLTSNFLNSLLQTDAQKELLNEVDIDGNNDKVWCLSYEEVTNADYGFDGTTDPHPKSDPMRTRGYTDYSKVEGIYVYVHAGIAENKSYWWLSSSFRTIIGFIKMKTPVAHDTIMEISPYVGGTSV